MAYIDKRYKIHIQRIYVDRRYPILEYDGDTPPLITPQPIDVGDAKTPYGILCFTWSIFDDYVQSGQFIKVWHFHSVVMGDLPVYSYTYEDKKYLVVNAGLGAPFAAASLEMLVAMGCTTIMAFGMAGVLQSELDVGHLIVPSAAIRDEGVSYHYLPPGREVKMKKNIFDSIISFLGQYHIPFEVGKTWTTDAFYRETKGKIRSRKDEGCIAVEMEASALLAVAEHRNVDLGYILGSGDDVSGDQWNRRDFTKRSPIHQKMFQICLDILPQL